MKLVTRFSLVSLTCAALVSGSGIARANPEANRALAKESNLVILNRLTDFSGATRKITGIYIIPATGKKLRDNSAIDWQANLINAPVEHGGSVALTIDIEEKRWYDYRIDFEGTDGSGKPLQYFHANCLLYATGTMVHHSIDSLSDNTSPWKVDTKLDPSFGKK